MDKTNILNISDLVVDEKYSKNYVYKRFGAFN